MGGTGVAWVTFDCYGTLIDWESGVVEALAPFLPAPVDRAAVAERYIALEAEVERDAYRPYAEVLALASARLAADLGRPLPPGRERALPDSLPSWRPFPDAPPALGALRDAGYRLAILSNVDRALLAASVARLGVAPDLSVTAEDCRSYKPAPDHWRRFEALSGAGPANTVHVAASLFHDIAPASALGYPTVFVNRRSAPAGSVSPTREVRDLATLAPVIAALGLRGARGAP
jgi:2-haloacid dehalogenase